MIKPSLSVPRQARRRPLNPPGPNDQLIDDPSGLTRRRRAVAGQPSRGARLAESQFDFGTKRPTCLRYRVDVAMTVAELSRT
jgi:hypothetical protein